MRTASADDFDTIGRARAEIQAREDFYRSRQCAIRSGGVVQPADCWCRNAGPNGESAPCPPPDG